MHCGGKIPKARAEIYQHCTNDDCVTAWKQERRSHMAIALIPKSGFTVVYRRDSHALGKTTKG